MKGDRILAFGSVRYKEEFQSFTVQLEKCEIVFLSEKFKEEAPFCPKCDKRMTSDGKEKGYKCRNCKYKNKSMIKQKTTIRRDIKLGLHIPPAQAQRHLVKPLIRYDLPLKSTFNIIDNWWKNYSNK
jgi:tRNA(Ile2)-agmatinylcytidine synthase